MRATINIEKGVMENLMKYTKSKTRAEAVNRALTDWVQHLKLMKLRALRGKLHLENNWKMLRSLEKREFRSTFAQRPR